MQKIKCDHCEADNPGNSRYCSRCGYELPKIMAEIVGESVQQPTPIKKRLSVRQMIGIGVGVGAVVVFQQFFLKGNSYDKEMMEVASELNKSCPIMVDRETRLDNAVALPDNIFQYHYTLVNREKASVDTLDVKNYLEPILINNVKTSPQMKIQRDHGTTLNYYYKDKAGQYLFMVTVTQEKYE